MHFLSEIVRFNFNVRAGSRREPCDIAQSVKPAQIESGSCIADQTIWAIIQRSRLGLAPTDCIYIIRLTVFI